MSILSTIPMSPVFSKKHYDLDVKQRELSIYIKMSMYTSRFHTNHFPSTLNILSQNLPAVLNTKCFNKNKYSFDKEVLNTEIGHLFEHILLQYLCELKLESGARNAVYKGLTQWDWGKDIKGTFHITLEVRNEDFEFFPEALRKTEIIMKKILESPIRLATLN